MSVAQLVCRPDDRTPFSIVHSGAQGLFHPWRRRPLHVVLTVVLRIVTGVPLQGRGVKGQMMKVIRLRSADVPQLNKRKACLVIVSYDGVEMLLPRAEKL